MRKVARPQSFPEIGVTGTHTTGNGIEFIGTGKTGPEGTTGIIETKLPITDSPKTPMIVVGGTYGPEGMTTKVGMEFKLGENTTFTIDQTNPPNGKSTTNVGFEIKL